MFQPFNRLAMKVLTLVAILFSSGMAKATITYYYGGVINSGSCAEAFNYLFAYQQQCDTNIYYYCAVNYLSCSVALVDRFLLTDHDSADIWVYALQNADGQGGYASCTILNDGADYTCYTSYLGRGHLLKKPWSSGRQPPYSPPVNRLNILPARRSLFIN